jgi:hypothetical protein
MLVCKYLPNSERLTVGVMKCRNVGQAKAKPPDVYVKVVLETRRDHKKIKKKKTSIQKASKNPVFNEELAFANIAKDQLVNDIQITVGMLCSIRLFNESLTNRNIQIQVCHESTIKRSKEILGEVAMHALAKGDLYNHWRDMIECKTSQKCWWHALKPVCGPDVKTAGAFNFASLTQALDRTITTYDLDSDTD